MKHFFLPKIAASIFSVGIVMAACNNKEDTTPAKTSFTLSGTASGSQETPPVTTSAMATVTGTYDKNTRMLTYKIDWMDLSDNAKAAHFHGPATAGVSAPVLVPLTITNPGRTGTASGSTIIADSIATFFMNGKMYFNVHTEAHPGGEIRAQTTLQ